jgi:hypothetical protein
MSTEPATTTATSQPEQMASNLARQWADGATALQKEFLSAYEQVSRAWVARAQSEAALWSDLAAKLSATRSPPEVLDACSKCMSRRIEMAMEDSRRMIEEYQMAVGKIATAMKNGSPSVSAHA